MPEWKDYDSRRTRPRLVVTLSGDAHDALERLASRRFGGNRSRAVEWAVLMAETILGDPRTLTATDPMGALHEFSGPEQDRS